MIFYFCKHSRELRRNHCVPWSLYSSIPSNLQEQSHSILPKLLQQLALVQSWSLLIVGLAVPWVTSIPLPTDEELNPLSSPSIRPNLSPNSILEWLFWRAIPHTNFCVIHVREGDRNHSSYLNRENLSNCSLAKRIKRNL